MWLCTLAVLTTVSAQRISRNGRCGASNDGSICTGSRYGDCCSQSNWCGTGPVFCGTGCNRAYGSCDYAAPPRARVSTSSHVARPSQAVKVSPNSRCGSLNGARGDYNCVGSRWGDCCSQYSYCGSGKAYCGAGCQSGFGNCTPGKPLSSVKSSSTRKSSTRISSSSSSKRSSTSVRSSTSTTRSTTRPTSVFTTSSGLSSAPVPSQTSTIATFTSSSLPSYSSSASPSPSPTPFLLNGDFEAGILAPWSVVGSYSGLVNQVTTTSPYAGQYAYQLAGNFDWANTIGQLVTAARNRNYNLGVWWKHVDAPGTCVGQFVYDGTSLGQTTTTPTAYASATAVLSVGSNTVIRLDVEVICTGFGQYLYIDDITATAA